MAQITFRGMPIHTKGDLPTVGEYAPDFLLVNGEMQEVSLGDFKGQNLILNIFPSIDTDTCAASVFRFHSEAAKLANTRILCISKDLPFAQDRFCVARGIKNVVMLSDFRGGFGENYPITFVDSPLKGLLSRCIVLINPEGKIIYTEQVPEIAQEPDYQKVFNILG